MISEDSQLDTASDRPLNTDQEGTRCQLIIKFALMYNCIDYRYVYSAGLVNKNRVEFLYSVLSKLLHYKL